MEGVHDVQFLVRLSRRLWDGNFESPDLQSLVERRRLVIIPMGGDLSGWAERLEALGCRQFHLYDRESEPETSLRRRLAEKVNARPSCHASMTTKRSLENYLHANAIAAAGGGTWVFDDDDCVASLLARSAYERAAPTTPWPDLSRRARQRLLNRAKRHLNTQAVEQMTPELLAERDPTGELMGWLTQIAAITAE